MGIYLGPLHNRLMYIKYIPIDLYPMNKIQTISEYDIKHGNQQLSIIIWGNNDCEVHVYAAKNISSHFWATLKWFMNIIKQYIIQIIKYH